MPVDLILALIAAGLAAFSIFADNHRHEALAFAVIALAFIFILPF